jgi:hypothetical protein
MRYGVFGSIKCFEMPCGRNGWHLHVHEIYFHNQTEINLETCFYNSFEKEMFPLWHSAVTRAGFSAPTAKHGLDIRNGDFAAEYIAKWGVEPTNLWTLDNEITRGHIKKSFNGLSPFDLLRQYNVTGNKMYAELFQEYAKVAKGKRQLMWSPNLKKYFEIATVTDKELATKLEHDALLLGFLNKEAWHWIVENNKRSHLYMISKNGGWDAVIFYLSQYVKNPEYDEFNLEPKALYVDDLMNKQEIKR